MKTKSLFTLLTILVIPLASFAQHEIGLKGNGGLSKSNLFYLDHGAIVPGLLRKNYFVPSGQAGLFYNNHIGKKSLIGSELLFMQFEGKEHSEYQFADSLGNMTGSDKTDIRWHFSYLSLPFYYGCNFKKLNVNLGGQINFVLTGKGKVTEQFSYMTSYSQWEQKLYRPQDHYSYNFGARVGLFYNFSNRFAIEANYYYSIANINKYNHFAGSMQQMTAGLRYRFFNKEQEQKPDIYKEQDTSHIAQKKNIIKTNLLGPFSLQYERVLSKKTSIVIGAKFWYINIISERGSLVPTAEIETICLYGEYRWYGLNSKYETAPEGLYLAPYFKYKKYIIGNSIYELYSKEFLAPGLAIGYQQIANHKMAIDFLFGIHQPIANSNNLFENYPALRMGVSIGYLFK